MEWLGSWSYTDYVKKYYILLERILHGGGKI